MPVIALSLKQLQQKNLGKNTRIAHAKMLKTGGVKSQYSKRQ
jgi:hypothetical protein